MEYQKTEGRRWEKEVCEPCIKQAGKEILKEKGTALIANEEMVKEYASDWGIEFPFHFCETMVDNYSGYGWAINQDGNYECDCSCN